MAKVQLHHPVAGNSCEVEDVAVPHMLGIGWIVVEPSEAPAEVRQGFPVDGAPSEAEAVAAAQSEE